jgi:hypothetical protein
MTTTVAQGDSTIAKTQNQEEGESLKTLINYITNERSYIAWLELSRKLGYMSKKEKYQICFNMAIESSIAMECLKCYRKPYFTCKILSSL